ncbi:MAG: sugar porter family MFS transporter, partial [Rubripirellula sp.]|nr:sugar porter family MFS transporter [Rubripirellula sp.]
MKSNPFFLAFIVSLGGFLFGFDAGIISGVMKYAGPQFSLDDQQLGWVVSSPSFAAMFAMLIAGRVSDLVGRKPILLVIALLYAISAILSAYATSYEMLSVARMLGGVAFGAALIIAPTYISEISTADRRGKLVSVQQLNIVFGFFAAFLCNDTLNRIYTAGDSFLTEETIWRWMLGIEAIPAVFYLFFLFFVPKSPRWLFSKNRVEEGRQVLEKLHGTEIAEAESNAIRESIEAEVEREKGAISELFNPALRFIMLVGLLIGILQQSTGINAIYFYATGIFEQTGIGTNAAFTSGVLLSFTTVVFTIIAMVLIDKIGRRPLMLVGVGGIAVSLLMCAYGFNQATYQLTADDIAALEGIETSSLDGVAGVVFESDVAFKSKMKELLGDQIYGKNEGSILENAIEMNASLVLAGILGFIACFAFSLGPVMWVMLSELYPNRIRGLAIGVVGFVNSLTSFCVQ